MIVILISETIVHISIAIILYTNLAYGLPNSVYNYPLLYNNVIVVFLHNQIN